MLKLLLFVVLSYGAVVAFMYGAQTSMIFPGTRLPSRPLDHPYTPLRLVIEREDGIQLRGLHFSPDDGSESDGLLIGFGGNAQDAEILGQELAQFFPELDVAVFHYRGYGDSGGRPSETALFADADAIYDKLVADLSPASVYAIGLSLGSGVAGHLSKTRPLDGVFLITPYDSIEAVATQAYPWLPVKLLLKHRFRTVDAMADNQTPVAIIAAEHDKVIRPERTEVLRTAVERLVFDHTVLDADHADLYARHAYNQALRQALDALKSASGAPSSP